MTHTRDIPGAPGGKVADCFRPPSTAGSPALSLVHSVVAHSTAQGLPPFLVGFPPNTWTRGINVRPTGWP